MALIDAYSEEELQEIVSFALSYKDVARALGYNSYSGDLKKLLEKRLSKFDTSHFSKKTKIIERNIENIFIENSTADQKTLRRWFIKGKYSDYKCSICGQEPIWQDKPLTLILDHINGHNHDNRLENLRWVCPNCNQQLETTGNKRGSKLTVKKYCVDCGKEISYRSTRCESCNNKHKKIPLEKMPVSREELKTLIRTQSFTSIGLKYGVSDNAIRKWCIKFNLPTKKVDIKKYTDKEWELI